MPVIALDPPVGGLNAFDSVAAMPPTDAASLVNWVPRSGFLEARPGFIEHVDGLGGPVETLTAWKGVAGAGVVGAAQTDLYNVFGGSGLRSAGTDQLLAAADGNVWNVTQAQAPVSLGSGFTNDRWQSEMINNRLVLVNGADLPQEFDGTTLTPMATWALWDEGSESFLPYSDANEFIGCVSFKGRMYYWKENSTSFWYAQPGGYTNEIFEFPLASVLQRGGVINTILSWTVDPGVGPDDMLVVIFDSGEFLVYQGDDPGNLGYFEQVGRFSIPDPLSIRCSVQFGSDVIIMTRAGYTSLESILEGEVFGGFPAFSRKIGRAVLDDGLKYASYYGHECIQTDSGFLIFNVPIGADKSHQYILNPNTKAWAKIEGYNAIAWEVFNNGSYFSGYDGKVYRLGGYADVDQPIKLDAVPAFQYLDNPGVHKQITAAQIISTHPEPRYIGISGISDFNIPVIPNSQPPAGTLEPTMWNEAEWNTDYWNRAGGVYAGTTKGWQNVHAFGYAVSLVIQMQVYTQNIQWRQTGIRYRMAGAQ